VQGLPTLIGIDAAGRIVLRDVGGTGGVLETLPATLDDLIAKLPR
jgi:hypothetical protein